jgi:hypothetical protein
MLNSNDYLISQLAKHREAELREKVRVARLLANARLEKPGLWARLLTRSGEVLIGLGQKLKARYEPEANVQLTQSHASLSKTLRV